MYFNMLYVYHSFDETQRMVNQTPTLPMSEVMWVFTGHTVSYMEKMPYQYAADTSFSVTVHACMLSHIE